MRHQLLAVAGDVQFLDDCLQIGLTDAAVWSIKIYGF